MRPLHWSALHGHLALLQSLLEMRADATAENHQKQTRDQRNVSEYFGDVKMHPPEICEIDSLGVFKKIVVQSILTPAGLINSLQKIVCICKIMASLAKPHRTCFGS